jgi:hypothetical protein
LVQTKGSTGAHGGVAHRGRGGKQKGVGVGSAHEKEKWGGPAGGTRQGHVALRGGQLRWHVEERRGAGWGTDPSAAVAGATSCGNRGGRRGG